MNDLLSWLETHEKLSGWAQFFGTVLALAITYLTAFVPLWQRKRQLGLSAARLLLNAYEVIESYHRTSANFLPFPLSLRAATLSMMGVAAEIDRFPVFDLDDQGSRSVARHLLATSTVLKMLSLFLESQAAALENREATSEDQEMIRTFVANQMDSVRAFITGAELKRPDWPPTGSMHNTSSNNEPGVGEPT